MGIKILWLKGISSLYTHTHTHTHTYIAIFTRFWVADPTEQSHNTEHVSLPVKIIFPAVKLRPQTPSIDKRDRKC